MNNKKLLLGILPFWDPLIPPMGIASLKSYLQEREYQVDTFSANSNSSLLEYYEQYFNNIRGYLGEEKHSILFHLGHFVLQNHLLAIQNYTCKSALNKLVSELLKQYLQIEAKPELTENLNQILQEFYEDLDDFIVKILDRTKPSVFGLSVYKGNLATSIFAFKIAKRQNPNIKTIMGGGVFADLLAKDSPNFNTILQETDGIIDKFFIGQSEKMLFYYLEGKLDDKQRYYSLTDDTSFRVTLDELPIPIYDDSDLNVNSYYGMGATGSVSCKYQCSFCNEIKFWGAYQKKDGDKLTNEILYLFNKYGFQYFFMTDSFLNPIVNDFANAIVKSGIPVYYDSYLRVDDQSSDINNTLLWRKGGFYRARIGVESGSQKILDLMDKRITIEQTKNTISSLAYAGIKTTTYWVIGFPGETEEDFQQTLKLLEDLKDDIYQAECAFFDYYYSGQSGSDLWKGKRKLLFSEEFSGMLLVKTWVLDESPGFDSMMDRLYRFVKCCSELNIPNPYSLSELQFADERWHKLHKNAVPFLIDLRNNNHVVRDHENIKLEKISSFSIIEEGNFNF